MATKIALSRLPVPYSAWKRLRLFEHGNMNQPQHALSTVLEYGRIAEVLDTSGATPCFTAGGDDFNVLELGPGDSLFTLVIARAFGAARTWLVDAGPFATTDMAAYLRLGGFLTERGFSLPAHIPETLAEMLTTYDAEYLTGGVASLARVPTGSVDFCFSNAVLEHVPKNDFGKLAGELLRVLKPGGVCAHRVDLKDHLGGGLNNLRFSEETWEGALFRDSGFYTNRIRFSEMVELFRRAGFSCTLSRVIRWSSVPLSRAKLDRAFRHLPDDDLLVNAFDIVLRRQFDESGPLASRSRGT